VLEPAVLLFDEPLSNLDARLRRQMREEIRSIQQRLKLTVAYVTHDQSEALAVSDQIIVMQDGLIAQSGTPQALYERPASEFVAGFMGEALLLPAQAKADGLVYVGPLTVSPKVAMAPGAAKVAVRPEAWTLAREPAGLIGTITKSAYLGGFYEYTLQTELGDIFVVSHELDAPFGVGDKVGMSLKKTGISVVAG
jgi:iron(III) transport system ATP-binding protein